MDETQWSFMRQHILDCIDDHAGEDGTVLLKDVVELAKQKYGDGNHPAFPTGNVRNHVTYTTVDLEARCEIERIPGKKPPAHHQVA